MREEGDIEDLNEDEYGTRHKLFSLFARSIACSRTIHARRSRALEKNPVKSRASISNDRARFCVRIRTYVRTYDSSLCTYVCQK